jgi:hypothetical protein
LPFCVLIQGSRCPHVKADIVFLLDTSGSIGARNFEKEKSFVAGYANGFDIGHSDIQIGAVTFANAPRREFDLKTYTTRPALMHGISRMGFTSGSTHTDLGIDFLLRHSFNFASGDRPHIPDIAIVVTDGQSANMASTIHEAQKLHSRHIEVIAIGVGHGAHLPELNGIASDPQHVFRVENFDSLHLLQAELQNVTCTCKLS